jgi:ParB family chromosome partitioning protein
MASEPRQRGLGRGLSALIGDYPATPAAASAPEAVRDASEVPVELVRANPQQPRRRFTEDELEELAASIRTQGVIQPILVRPVSGPGPERYEIVAGERRWRAAQRAGLSAVPVVVRALDDLQTLEIGIIENVQRADLNAVEEARGYQSLIDRFGRTQAAVAEAVGKSRAHVANMLRILALPEPILDLLRDGVITAGHARAALMADDPASLARTAASKGLSVRDTERLAQAGRAASPRGRTEVKGEADADTRALEQDLAHTLGLPVSIASRAGGGGSVTISWRSLEQLDDICRRLSRTGGPI